MPNFDGTGPDGKGPLTGRQRGRCKPDDKTPRGNRPRRGRNNPVN